MIRFTFFLLSMLSMVGAKAQLNVSIFEVPHEEISFYTMPEVKTINYLNALKDRSGFDIAVGNSIGYINYLENGNLGIDVNFFYDFVFYNPDHYEFFTDRSINSNLGIGLLPSYKIGNVGYLQLGFYYYWNTYLNDTSFDISLKCRLFVYQNLGVSINIQKHLSNPWNQLVPLPQLDPESNIILLSVFYMLNLK